MALSVDYANVCRTHKPEAAVCTVITVGTLHMSRDRTRLLNFF
jgi:hypothetical protein